MISRHLAFAAVTAVATQAAAQSPTDRDGAWHMPHPTAPAAASMPPPAAAPEPAAAGNPPYTTYGYPSHYASYAHVPHGLPAYYAPQRPAVREEAGEEETDPLAPPNLDLALGTIFPLSIGPQITLELPGRLLLQSDIGWMPPAYGSLVNGMVRRFGGYEPALESLVSGALEDALVFRATGGWRPFPEAGFEMFGGYTLIDLHGSAVPADVAMVVAGEVAAAVAESQLGDRVELDSTLHSFHVGLGWRWVAFDHLVIRANLAYMQTVSSSSSVEAPDAPDLAEEATRIVDERLGEIYARYVKLPVLGLTAGYRF